MVEINKALLLTSNHCPICDKVFFKRKSLNNHIMVHVRSHKCLQCGKVFGHKSNMNSHVRTVHETSGILLNCHHCVKVFHCQVGLKKHLKLHYAPEKRFTCNVCQKAFYYKQSLQDHVRIHTGERPYFCHYCFKTFRIRHQLKNHERLHTGEKPFKCAVCAKAFRLSSNLSVHAKTHRDEKLYQCPFCLMSFKNKRNSQRHLSTCSLKANQTGNLKSNVDRLSAEPKPEPLPESALEYDSLQIKRCIVLVKKEDFIERLIETGRNSVYL